MKAKPPKTIRPLTFANKLHDDLAPREMENLAELFSGLSAWLSKHAKDKNKQFNNLTAEVENFNYAVNSTLKLIQEECYEPKKAIDFVANTFKINEIQLKSRVEQRLKVDLKRKLIKRNDEIIKQLLEGKTLKQVAEIYNISTSQVHRISKEKN